MKSEIIKIKIPEISLEIGEMLESDLVSVLEIERRSFAVPWSENAFREGLSDDYPHVYFRVARHNGKAIAMINFWVVEDDVHIANFAVSPDHRKGGIGSYFLAKSLETISVLGGRKVFLEVRQSNIAAQNLYRRFRFRIAGVRKKYYTDNGENAYVLWLKNLDQIRFDYAHSNSITL